jgi:hypothetical protein
LSFDVDNFCYIYHYASNHIEYLVFYFLHFKSTTRVRLSKLQHRLQLMLNIQQLGTSTTLDHKSGDQIVWYIVKTIRLEDKVTNTVHRRFKDFGELNSQVKQNFKGHHLRYLYSFCIFSMFVFIIF